MKTNDDIEMSALISEVELYGINLIQEIESNLDGKGETTKILSQ